jgi:hypothetical protein
MDIAMRILRYFMYCWVLPLFCLTGCGEGSNVVEVTGTLTYKGTPVTNALIHFEPEHGRVSWAQTDDQGRFKINYDAHQDGAVIGKHKVWLEMRATSAADQEAEMLGKKPKMSKEMAALFDKYSGEKSKFTVEITRQTKELALNLD